MTGLYRREVPVRHRRVLLVLLTGADGLGGFTVCDAAQVSTGTFYPQIARMERHGWVAGTWEQVPAGQRRRPRKFYRLTPYGRLRAAAVLGLEHRDGSPDWPGTGKPAGYRMGKAEKRIVMALLPGAPNADFTLLRWLTGLGRVRFTRALNWLQDGQWITARPGPRRLPCYQLTAEGRMRAPLVLHLTIPAPGGRR